MTLQELAEIVGTTPQTIQRLETNNMTVSVDWLFRIADALGLSPADLLQCHAQRRMLSYLGDLGQDGMVKPFSGAGEHPIIDVSLPCDDPVAVKVTAPLGPFADGTILVAERLDRTRHATADGRDCLVALAGGELIFRRLVMNGDGTKAYVPYTDHAKVERDLDIDWIAPVVMWLRYSGQAQHAGQHQP